MSSKPSSITVVELDIGDFEIAKVVVVSIFSHSDIIK